jgi:predicted transcriptional regulator
MDILGPLQLKIMNHLWDINNPQTGQSGLTAQDIADYLNEKGSKYGSTTISSVMATLEARNLVTRKKVGRSFIFESMPNGAHDYRLALMRYVVFDVYGANADGVFATLLEVQKQTEVPT